MKLARLLLHFMRSQRASVAIQFGLLLVPVLGIAGAALDYASAARVRESIQAAVDSAALAAASAVRDSFYSVTRHQDRQALAQRTFDGYLAANGWGGTANPGRMSLRINGNRITVTGDLDASSPTTLLQLFGRTSLAVGGHSTTTTAVGGYIDVYMLIDTSGSMAIGATSADVTRLRNEIGCAFACHDGNNAHRSGGRMVDAYTYAVERGITLRYHVVNRALINLADYISTQPNASTRYRIAIYSFDRYLNTNLRPTSNFSQVATRVPAAPATSGEQDGATRFNEVISSFLTEVGAGGDGSSPNQPQKIVILLTDGVQDPGRFWVSQPAYRTQVAPIGIAFCDTLRRNGIQIGVVQTPYEPMSWDWGYNETLGQPSQLGGRGTRHDDIEPQLRACAGPLYANAATEADITAAFRALLDTAVGTRITQ
jgi:Flp pilus assembly protein TadG